MASPVVKNAILFVTIVGGLALGVAVFSREPGSSATAPKWKEGDVVPVEVTVVSTDKRDLACASDKEVAGRRCQFEAKNKPLAGGPTADDDKLLQPYTTVESERTQFLGAGLWTSLKDQKLPNVRFTAKCKLTVEGKLKSHAIRWSNDGPWYDQSNNWFAGLLHECTIGK